ncbi:DMT family transporter [Methanothermococcus sp. Ax23]|jgi:transporter family protein|uniref:EamA family transporter n=1 Tax=Methanothermococcus sp. Ax23 TaxID=3156486 RepID=UPI003BA34B90
MKGEFLALIVATLWGITPLIEKKALDYIDPLTAVFIIICMNFLIISSVFIMFGKINIADLSSIPIKPIIYLAMVSILAGVAAQYLFYRALEASSPSKVVIITSMYPLITILATSIISKEFPSIKMVCGAFLVFMGIFLVMD